MTGDTFDLIACGVGGQGVVLMCNAVGEACALADMKAISGEMHGLAQRSGSVFIHQRIGERALAPLVPYGEADVILALEPMEALRHLHYLAPGGLVITNTHLVHPPGETNALATKQAEGYIEYDTVMSTIREAGARVIEIDALELANRAGNALTENVVMVGALAASAGFPVAKEAMLEGVKAIVPPKAVAVNEKAFESGYAACRKAQ